MKENAMMISIKRMKTDTVIQNKKSKYIHQFKNTLFWFFRLVILIGISFLIMQPIIDIIGRSFFSSSDVYNPSVILIPRKPTLGNYELSFIRLDYWKTLGYTLIYIVGITLIQIFISSMAGYGFARFDFPCKKILFACVILTIILPVNSIMIPLYQHFRSWDIFGIVEMFSGKSLNLLSSEKPMYIMSLFGNGLKSGLFIFIFNQFFRGLPKEIEEAAFIDGAGMFYTYFRIMLVNALPSVITVSVLSLVWQYNDSFYSILFTMPTARNITYRLSTIQATIMNQDMIKDPLVSQLNVYAGVILVIIPILAIYVILQKYFIEGVERSGIVG